MSTIRQKQARATAFMIECMYDWWDNGHGDGFASWVDNQDLPLQDRLEKIYGDVCIEKCGALPSDAQFRVIERACLSDLRLRDKLRKKGLEDYEERPLRVENVNRLLGRYFD